MSAKDYLATLRTSPRVRKYLRRALIALLSTYAAYLLLANVFLGFHLLDRVVTSDDGTVELRTGRAYSFIPGRASVRDFVLRLDNENMQVRLTVARATTSVNLFKLLSREIKLSGVEASGVSFRIRMRVDAIRPDNAERVAAFPDIEGALGPPLLSAAIPVPDKPVEKAWHVDLVDAVVHADEVWIQEYRVTGDISAAGGFTLWPGKDFMLRPSTFHVGAGMVRVGPRIVTNDMKIRTGTADIAKLSLQDTKGPDILRYLTASASGSSTLQDASFLEVYPSAGIPQIRVEPSRSTFLARFAGGMFLEGTTAAVDVPQGSARVEGSFVVSGAVNGRIAVPKDGEIEIGADSALTQIELSYLPSTKAAPFSAHNTSFRQTLQVVVGEPLRAGVGAYRSELHTPTLGWMEDLAKGGLKTRGRGVGTIDLTRDASGAITGSFSARLEEATLATKDLSANVSSVTRGGVVIKAKPEEGVTVTRVTVEAPRASVQADGRPPHTTWFRADIPSVTVTLSPRMEVRASADLSAGDGGLVAGIVESQIGVVLGPVAAHFLEGPPGMSVRGGPSDVGARHHARGAARKGGHGRIEGFLRATRRKNAARGHAAERPDRGGPTHRRRGSDRRTRGRFGLARRPEDVSGPKVWSLVATVPAGSPREMGFAAAPAAAHLRWHSGNGILGQWAACLLPAPRLPLYAGSHRRPLGHERRRAGQVFPGAVEHAKAIEVARG